MADDAPFREKGPLANVRVLEMGVLIAGPFCGQLLADFGAEVIKIEQPGEGDPMRGFGQAKVDGKTLWWPVVARNKKSVTLNLRAPEGQEIVRDLVAQSDVVVENFRPGTLERWNLGYDALSAINPGLILARVTGYGQTGPYAGRAGFGVVGEAMGGLRHVVGEPSMPPSRVGISLGDSLAATYAALGILMAMNYRQATGRGQVVDSAIYEAVLANMESLIPEYQHAGYIRERSGAILPKIAPSNAYPTKDGLMIMIAANHDAVFKRMAEAMGRPELADEGRFGLHTERGERQQELDDIIAAWTATLDADAILEVLIDAGVPAGKIYRAPEMLADPHYAAREAIVTVTHPDFGEVAMQNAAPKLSETPGRVNWAGPALGQHNNEIYQGLLGMDAGRLDALKADGII